MDILKAIGKYLLEALPQIVTIISIIVSAIVQIGASKRETTRTIESYKQMLETERIKSERAMEMAILEKRLAEQKENYDVLSAQYAKILDAFYPNGSGILAATSIKTIYAEAMKMMGRCAPNSDLYSCLESLTACLYEDVTRGIGEEPVSCDYVESWIKAIAHYLHEMSISHSLEQGTLLTKQTEE